MYRHVIKIWEKHSTDVVNVDRLPRIHTLENLADLLDADHCSVSDGNCSVKANQPPVNSLIGADQCSSSTDQCSVSVNQSSNSADQCSASTDQSSNNTDQCSAIADQCSNSSNQCSTSTDQCSGNRQPLRDEDLRSEVRYSSNPQCNFLDVSFSQ